MTSCLFMLNKAERLVCTGFAAAVLPATPAALTLKTAGKQGYYGNHSCIVVDRLLNDRLLYTK
jgi:hypothetical protein